MLLLDSNILLEYLLDQEKADSVEQLLRHRRSNEFHYLIIVSFDSDFDQTDKERKTPAEVMST